MNFLALSIPVWLEANLQWYIAGVIVVVGLIGFGLSDVLRFSLTRVWAISGVSFDESIRRRVLWITPLAIVGVIIVSQLQHPADEQDAIYQTTKFCLFATGTLLVITTIILACTNLPKEIDNRVIYTVVTKPTTRLEIILGKILGFARVSATILLIMGVFSFGYLKLRAVALENDIRQRLKTGAVDSQSRPTLEHYQRAGLLTSRVIARPQMVQFYSRMPDLKSDLRWFVGGTNEQSVVVPFDLTDEDLQPADNPDAAPGSSGLLIQAQFDFQPRTDIDQPTDAASQPFIPTPLLASTQPSLLNAGGSNDPLVQVEVLDFKLESLIPAAAVNQGHPGLIDDQRHPLQFGIDPNSAQRIAGSDSQPIKRIFVRLAGLASGLDYGLRPETVKLVIPPQRPGGQAKFLASVINAKNPDIRYPVAFQGRVSAEGQQIRGRTNHFGSLAAFHFENAGFSPDSDGNVPMEIKLAIERSGDENLVDDAATHVSIQVLNYQTGALSDPILLTPESRRLAYFNVPAGALEGGTFDIVAKCLTDNHWLTFIPTSVGLIESYDSFAVNLFKSLLILWLMSLLVITISIFCSTFVSWPIAIVLTLVILLGRWGVLQLQDSLTTGIGHEVVNTWFPGSSPPVAKTISSSVELLTRGLNALAKILPDVEQFPVTLNIDHGLSIPWGQLLGALGVMGSFAFPLTVLAFVLLKHKEVAP